MEIKKNEYKMERKKLCILQKKIRHDMKIL